ncbi:hypothetical protein [Acidithiobacillus sp.]|uniref:hypothetical protein n=1 Tax=Acidithiobacillus sp. TaxID=1872118 RepID=UPI00231D219F|nr:hypothetical protein [Acidithiobacillus sp.]MDA8245484.1 hypothetical protein [Acidithiobacillus sp.]
MTGIYDSTMTAIERRLVYDAEWTRLDDEWTAAYLRKDVAAMDTLWQAMQAREAELGGDDDGG